LLTIVVRGPPSATRLLNDILMLLLGTVFGAGAPDPVCIERRMIRVRGGGYDLSFGV
jgi:hypothetical protein